MTRMCSTEPPSGKVSHQHPPGRASSLRLLACPEKVCSELHQFEGCSRAAYTLSGAAAMCAASRASKPCAATLTTAAGERTAPMATSTDAAPAPQALVDRPLDLDRLDGVLVRITSLSSGCARATSLASL